MASGHMNRVKRPDTWLHRPMLRNVKKVLANPEPSTHDPERTSDAAEPILSAKQEADAIIGLQEPGYSYSPAPPRSDFLAEPSLFRAFHETSLL
jgi:hypothetical protein